MWRVGLVRLCAFSWALKLAFVFTVKAIEVYTPKELIVENGTQAKLPCTFKTSEVVSSSTAVTWIFKPEGGGRSFTFFYYTSGRHFMDVAPFKDRVSWAGDLNKKDASIYIKNMQFQDNGTYFCDLKNPPDIDATVTGEIQLKVVEKGNLPPSKAGMVAGIVIGAIWGLLLLIGIIVFVIYKKKYSKKHYSGCSTTESLMSSVKQAPRKLPSDAEGLVNSVPARSHQGPIIYAQLDHSGGKQSNQINKSESVVYADLRKS
ncbi:myelin protein zero-like protein 1 isoform X1 [Microcaecilia unicolor]|uniref:Myelin protein P0 n=1 Tax=Microcaecilia unicolor TaxID=1415580 RepID=A0A6P7Y3X5_9AMPH|nr:myelin protein zero-like protein 1 isoform X1 [Microcaecilia unicolor]